MNKYAILDNVTAEWLSEYPAINWDASELPEKLAIFNSEKEAEVVVDSISMSFLKYGEEVDFSIVLVTLVTPLPVIPQPYYERVQ